MVRENLRILPKFRDGLSYVYIEHCIIEQDAKAIAIIDKYGKTPIPCANLSLLLIGPGTSITHTAIQVLAQNGCLICWIGENGVRFYAMGTGETRSAKHILHQAQLVSDKKKRTEVVRRMYIYRFKERIEPNLSIRQLRGKEGARMRQIYQEAAKTTGIKWTGRKYDPNNWKGGNAVNRALSVANSCLYGLCHAAIIAAGYSPALGFIHTGQQLSFVYDIADLYKAEMIPSIFQLVASRPKNLDREVRMQLRNIFYQTHLIERILPDIDIILDFPTKTGSKNSKSSEFTSDISSFSNLDEEVDVGTVIAGNLWDPENELRGGKNYGEIPSEKEESQ